MGGVSQSLAIAFAYFDDGRLIEAEAICQAVLKLAPNDADALHLMGALAFARGAPQDALAPIVRAIALSPDRPIPHNTLGCAELALERADNAAASHERALALKPDYVEAAINLGAALRKVGKLALALEASRRAATVAPDVALAWSNLGAVLDELGSFAEAVDSFRRALAIDPTMGIASYNLGHALVPLGQPGAAAQHYWRALALDPTMVSAHLNLGNACLAVGAIDLAIACFRLALSLDPGHSRIHSNLLVALLSHPRVGAEELFAECRRWEDRHGRPHYPSAGSYDNDRDPDRPLRIGYLSADLRIHSIANNIDGLYTLLNPDEFDLLVYADVARPDEMTRKIKERATRWVSIVDLGDREVADIIRADRVDLLVCVAGHSADNRIVVCAYRPAPIQISFLDMTTSGLSVVDYLVTDSVVHPAQVTERFTEKLIHLPVCMTHRPPDDAPMPGPPPAAKRGYVTFGSCNNLGKVNEEVIELWSRVLHAVPNSRLLLKYVNRFADHVVRQRFVQLFAQRGIDEGRLMLRGEILPRAQHLDVLNEIDIALDPFPFNGCTTTFEALWMGVPVVTLAGNRFVARMGASQLTAIGLTDLIADSHDDYVDIATKLAAGIGRLGHLRGTLRAQVARSPLCDHAGLARAAGTAFRQIWRDWCRGDDR